MKSVLKHEIKRIFKWKDYEIFKCVSPFGDWKYRLCYKGAFRIDSYDFNRLKTIAINDTPWLAN